MGAHSSLDTSGFDALRRRLNGADDLVRTFAFQVEANAKTSIQTGAKTGRLSKRGKNKFHRASAPGEAPATDTGRLVNSLFSRRERFAMWIVGASVIYAAILEKVLNRPFLSSAIEKVRVPFLRAVGRLINPDGR